MAYMMGEVDRPQMPRVVDGYSATHKVAVNMSLHRGGSNEAIRKPRKPALSSDSLSLSPSYKWVVVVEMFLSTWFLHFILFYSQN